MHFLELLFFFPLKMDIKKYMHTASTVFICFWEPQQPVNKGYPYTQSTSSWLHNDYLLSFGTHIEKKGVSFYLTIKKSFQIM